MGLAIEACQQATCGQKQLIELTELFNFIIRRWEACVQITATAFSLLAAAAYATLTASGVLLWRNTRSLATAMVTIGFAILLIDQVVLLVGYLRISASAIGHPGDTLFIIYHRANSLRVTSFGLWIAALGLMWPALQGGQRKRTLENR